MVYYITSAVVAPWLICVIYRKKRGQGKSIYVDVENCTGCKSCVKRCRHGVLEWTKDGQGAYVRVRNQTACTACGDCIAMCKFEALKLVKNN